MTLHKNSWDSKLYPCYYKYFCVVSKMCETATVRSTSISSDKSSVTITLETFELIDFMISLAFFIIWGQIPEILCVVFFKQGKKSTI